MSKITKKTATKKTHKGAAPATNKTGQGRFDGRGAGDLRHVSFERNYLRHAAGSVLTSFGDTRVLCTASLEQGVPPFLRNSGRGWVTAEYGMLPASTHERNRREAARGKQGGRTLEIQRLIGRSLRAVVNMEKLGERTITIDCDVIQADGGTRTASITGSWIALVDAVQRLIDAGLIDARSYEDVVHDQIAAVSVGVVGGNVLLDLCYEEDSKAETDLNVVMTGSGGFVELQGTAEAKPFTDRQLAAMIKSAKAGISDLMKAQHKALAK